MLYQSGGRPANGCHLACGKSARDRQSRCATQLLASARARQEGSAVSVEKPFSPSYPTRAVDLVEIAYKSKESQCAAGEKPHTVEIARVARWGALVGCSILLRDF